MGRSHLLLYREKHFSREEAKEKELNKERQIHEEVENMHIENLLLEQELEQAKTDKVEAEENRRILDKLYDDKIIEAKSICSTVFL